MAIRKPACFLYALTASLRGYALAFLLVTLALGITHFIQPYLSFSIPFIFLIGAVMVTSWHAGLGPALFATGLAALLAGYSLAIPTNVLMMNLPDLLAIGLFGLEGVAVAYFINHLQTCRRDATAIQDQLKKLYLHSSRLLEKQSLTPMFAQVLSAGMDLVAAEKGIIQLYDPHDDVLRLIAQIGFPPDVTERFQVLPMGFSTCGAACRSKRRIVVENINLDPEFARLAPDFARYGVMAVQSTPLIQEDGEVLGVLSTYTSTPYRPPAGQLNVLDLYTRQAERILESKYEEERLQKANNHLESTVTMKSGQLLEHESRVRSLMSELLLSEEHQRRQLAAELHDYLTQLLVLAKMKLRQALRELTSPSEARGYVDQADQLLKNSVDYARTLIAELCPPELRQSGLAGAIRWLAEQMPQHGLTVDLHLTHEVFALPHDRASLLYQSIRELLINAVKHAHVDRATVSLRLDGCETLVIVVEDRGPGFNVALLSTRTAAKHFGLASLQERMAAIDGSALIRSVVGEGTTVTLRVPLQTAVEPMSLRAANGLSYDRVTVKAHGPEHQQTLPLE